MDIRPNSSGRTIHVVIGTTIKDSNADIAGPARKPANTKIVFFKAK
jgi:hypothetical protein